MRSVSNRESRYGSLALLDYLRYLHFFYGFQGRITFFDSVTMRPVLKFTENLIYLLDVIFFNLDWLCLETDSLYHVPSPLGTWLYHQLSGWGLQC